MAENAGGVYITIDGDSSPLLAKYAQAEAQSRAAGQRIAGALGQGFQQSTGLVDQFGRSIQSVTGPTEGLASAVKQVGTSAASAAPAIAEAAVATEKLATASGHAVTEVQATSGALRVLEGSGGLRAAERFIATTVGLGSAFATLFPIVGLIAVAEIVTKVIDKFSGAKKNAEEFAAALQETNRAGETLVKTLDDINVNKMTQQFGAAAGGRMQAEVLEMQSMDKIAEMAKVRTQISNAGNAGFLQKAFGKVEDVDALKQKLQQLSIEAQDLATKADEAGNKANQVTAPQESGTQQSERIANAQEHADRLIELNRDVALSAVDSQHNADREAIASMGDRIAAASAGAAEEIRTAREKQIAISAADQKIRDEDVSSIRRKAGADSLGQDADKRAEIAIKAQGEIGAANDKLRQEESTNAKALANSTAQAQINADKEVRAQMLHGLEEGLTASQRAEEERIRAMQAEGAERNRLNQEQIRAGGVQTQNRDDLVLIQAKQNYQAQIVHSKAEELAYTAEIQSLEEQALKDRIANLEALKEYEILNGLVKESDQTDLEIERAKAALKKQQVTDQGALLQQGKSQTLAGQIQAKVGTGPANLVDAKNLVIANGIGTAVDGIASAMGRAVQGGQKLSQIFSQLGKSILGSVVQSIVKIGLQMVTTALLGKAAGSAIAVAEVTSAAAVGAANAAAATAAIPIVGPELAPGVAAATFAEIMAFAPLASYDKGGMIPRDMIAQVHKDEYVLTADQVSGRSPMPSLPGTGVVGSASAQFTNTASSNSYANSLSVGAIHLHGVQNVEDVARRLPNVLKTRSPIFSPATR